MANPRKLRKYYMKLFQKNVELYNEFLGLYDEAVKEGSAIPEQLAMIRLREHWVEGDEGWIEK